MGEREAHWHVCFYCGDRWLHDAAALTLRERRAENGALVIEATACAGVIVCRRCRGAG